MPIYRNQETGHEVEVMPGTRLPKVYKQVEKKTAPKPPANTTDKQDKPAATGKKSAGKKSAGKSATANKAAGAKADKPANEDEKPEKDQPAAQPEQ